MIDQQQKRFLSSLAVILAKIAKAEGVVTRMSRVSNWKFQGGVKGPQWWSGGGGAEVGNFV